ncbi:MAG: arsenate reductase ArsC [Candidatus Methanofastidiosum sp.]|nr:arsenate reductase ArsC [Methanofastidiosum sp.]
MKKKVLFLCTHNSARSQMAEGLLNSVCGDKYEAYSAGSTPTKINPFSIQVLKDFGIDISKHYSKSTEQFIGKKFEYVVTVCDNAKEMCPFIPGAKNYVHREFEDPSRVEGTDNIKLNAFRKSRDEIREWIIEFFCDKN